MNQDECWLPIYLTIFSEKHAMTKRMTLNFLYSILKMYTFVRIQEVCCNTVEIGEKTSATFFFFLPLHSFPPPSNQEKLLLVTNAVFQMRLMRVERRAPSHIIRYVLYKSDGEEETQDPTLCVRYMYNSNTSAAQCCMGFFYFFLSVCVVCVPPYCVRLFFYFISSFFRGSFFFSRLAN